MAGSLNAVPLLPETTLGRSSRACIICEAGSAAASILGSEGWLRGEHAAVHEAQVGGIEGGNRTLAYGRFCEEETPPSPENSP